MLEKEKRTILEILKIEREMEKRKGLKRLQNYNSGPVVHEKQMQFHKSLKRNRWVFGGNRTGKTECGAVEAVWFARGIHPYRKNRAGVNGWVVSVSYEVQREVAQAKILEYLSPDWIEEIVMQSGRKDSPSSGIIDCIAVKNVLGKSSRIYFKSADQGREKFQGASLDFVWFDEEPPEDIYRECQMRVMDKKGDIWGTMTPLKGLSWVYYEIFLNPRGDSEIWHCNFEWKDNPFLSDEEVERMIAGLSPELQESRRFGRFKESEGLVYPEFDPDVHVIEPFDYPEEWQYILSIDPGLNNPLSCHFYLKDDDGVIYVAAEHYEAGRDIDYHTAKIKELADKLNWKRDSKGRIEALIDSAANQRTLSGAKSVAELFTERGILVNTKVKKDLFSGIQTIKCMLASKPPRLFVFSNCRNMIREFKSYWWAEGDRPKKADDHCMDELRYLAMYNPLTPVRKTAKTDLQLDIERLIRKRG